MASLRSRAIKAILRSTVRRKRYSSDRVVQHRAKFERTSKKIFLTRKNQNIETLEIAGIPVAWITPKEATDRTIIYLHGGGFTFGSIRTHQQHMLRLAKICKARVLAIEYSLAPESPYPKALDELIDIWKEITQSAIIPDRTAIIGDSAGGNLTLAMALRIRDQKLPKPSCLVLLSPALDATFRGESYTNNSQRDPMLNQDKLKFFMESYIGSDSKQNPYISPVFADLHNLSPFLIHIGRDEILLSDSITIMEHAKRDKADAKIYVADGVWHGWHLFAAYAPEAKRAMNDVAKYVIDHTK